MSNLLGRVFVVATLVIALAILTNAVFVIAV